MDFPTVFFAKMLMAEMMPHTTDDSLDLARTQPTMRSIHIVQNNFDDRQMHVGICRIKMSVPAYKNQQWHQDFVKSPLHIHLRMNDLFKWFSSWLDQAFPVACQNNIWCHDDIHSDRRRAASMAPFSMEPQVITTKISKQCFINSLNIHVSQENLFSWCIKSMSTWCDTLTCWHSHQSAACRCSFRCTLLW